MNVLEVKDLTKTFKASLLEKEKTILDNVNLFIG